MTVNNNRVGSAATVINNGAIFDGDGIFINDTAQGGVTATANTVIGAEDDGIAVVNTGLNVSVTSNVVASIGAGTQAGDGIVVTGTGLVGTLGNLNGDVLVIGNTVSAVDGDGSADQHDGLSSGDGIRVSNVDGNAMVGNDGNTVIDVGDDGIEINGVAGNVSSSNNTIANTSTVTTTGDGIVITNVGNAYFGGGLTGRTVFVNNNTITTVGGDGTLDTLTDGLSGGDGIRVSDVDGSITVSNNIIQSIGNDGIQGYNINNTALVSGNQLNTISNNSGTGDGIVIENTGKYAATGGVAQGGSVTIVSNSVANVVNNNTDLDTDTISAGATQGLTSGDGIRVGAIDGEVLIGGSSTTGNTDHQHRRRWHSGLLRHRTERNDRGRSPSRIQLRVVGR